MNYFLQLNKKILLIVIIFLSLTTFITLFFLNFQFNNQTKNNSIKVSSYDILQPKFTINNKNQKIYVTANEANVISVNKIILKNNVIFKSKKFKIYAENVLFNKKKQTARTNKDSLFISNRTKIQSKGFNMVDQGSIIKFNGKTLVTISK